MTPDRAAAAPYPSIYLASQSPRRRLLLEQIGVRFAPLPPAPGEDAETLEAVLGDESPEQYVVRVCAAKAQAAARWLSASGGVALPILTADTTVALDGRILGKPADAAHAHAMLAQLAGRTHHVLTAVALTSAGSRFSALSVSAVRMADMDAPAIARYVASGEPFGKAGGYGIQGAAAEFIAHIDGSYSGIMGLPLFETAGLLRLAGVAF